MANRKHTCTFCGKKLTSNKQRTQHAKDCTK